MLPFWLLLRYSTCLQFSNVWIWYGQVSNFWPWPCLVFSELFGECHQFWKISTMLLCTYFFHPFLSFSSSSISFYICCTFCNYPTVPGCFISSLSSFFSFHSFFLFNFQFETSLSSLILSSAMPSLLMSPSKAFSLSVTVFLIPAFPFGPFSGLPPLCLHFICSCTFPQ